MEAFCTEGLWRPFALRGAGEGRLLFRLSCVEGGGGGVAVAPHVVARALLKELGAGTHTHTHTHVPLSLSHTHTHARARARVPTRLFLSPSFGGFLFWAPSVVMCCSPPHPPVHGTQKAGVCLRACACLCEGEGGDECYL